MSALRQHTVDSELWDAVKRDEAPAFKALYDRYWQTIFSTAFSYLHDREVCIEIVQDIFLSIWLKRHHLEMDSVYHYLTAAARYQVYKRIQQKGDLKVIYTDTIRETAGHNALNEGENNIRYDELLATVDRHLLDLPDRCREIFILSRKEQLSIAEIAARLGISKRTVENQLTRALQHLRGSLGDLYIAFIVLGWALTRS